MPFRVSRFSTASIQEGVAGFELPPIRSIKGVPNQGWQYSVEVRPSLIPAAGNGRFAKEAVKAKSIVVEKVLMPMANIETLVNLPNNASITFATVADLEKYIGLANKEGGYSREEVHDLFEHFMYGFDGQNSVLNVSTWTVNHGDDEQKSKNVNVVEKQLDGGAIALVGEATSDIQENEEFYMDYRKFALPKFYIDYTNEHGFKDVRTATVEAVYGVE